MFCGECGTKCNKDDLFCGECGAKLKREGDNESKHEHGKEVKKRKPLSKKNKILIAIISIIVVALIIVTLILSNASSPKAVAGNFFKALANNDGKEMYKYLNVTGDNTFASEKNFTKIIEQQGKDNKIENYGVTNVTYGTGKISASVTISYTTKNSSKEQTMVLSLTKAKDKKWLFFDDWNVNFENNALIVEDFEIYVPKESKVVYDDVNVTDKYLDDKKSSDEKDCYVLPNVFTYKAEVKVTLNNGVEIKDDVTPSVYNNSYTATLSLDNVDEKEQAKIKDVIKKDLVSIYNGVIQNKGFEDVKNNLSTQEKNEKVKSAYEDLLEELQDASNTLTAIDFTEITLYSIVLDKNMNQKIRFKVNYTYSIKYQDFSGNEATKDSSDYSYIDFIYSIKDGNYHLVDIDNLEDYFSRY